MYELISRRDLRKETKMKRRQWRDKEQLAEVARRSVSAVVTDAQWKWLVGKAAQTGTSQAAYLRRMVELAMRAERGVADLAARAESLGDDVADACNDMGLRHGSVRALLHDVAKDVRALAARARSLGVEPMLLRALADAFGAIVRPRIRTSGGEVVEQV